MEEKKTSAISSGLIWFGAGVSIAEIFTGTLIAPLGFFKGTAAILLGHIIGCMLLFAVGLIGAKNGRSAMDTVKMSFGKKGALLFSVLNILQLVGWTAIMIIQGGRATDILAGGAFGVGSDALWCVLIGALIIVWILVGVKNLGKLNTVVMSVLFILTIVLSVVLFSGDSVGATDGGMSFGAAVELAVAMPISWLPVISDYTMDAEKPFGATLAGTAAYFASSVWMYMLGMAAVIFTGCGDIAEVMLKAGLGIAGIAILIASTVTTTFLDAYSAGVSAESISKKINVKTVAIAIVLLGVVLAIFTPIEKFTDFLYLIGSVFAPMAAIQITEYILKKDYSVNNISLKNIIVWAIGFLIYRVFMLTDTPVGYTLPAMIVTGGICLAAELLVKSRKK